MEIYGNGDKRFGLRNCLKNVNPDDAYNSSKIKLIYIFHSQFFLAQYYKGAALLWFLEHNIVCSEKDFNQFFRSYVVKFSYRILSTDDFIQYFESYFPNVAKVDWNFWLYTPANEPSLISSDHMKVLNTNQITYLLYLLNQQPINYDINKKIDENCQMSKYSNKDICYLWYQLCIQVKYIESLDNVFKFLRETGEFKSSWPEIMPRVFEFFEHHKRRIYPLLVKTLEQQMGA
ncbi:unnamed protein product [Adineta steineri]|uniref:Peptidase M1 leukotriene A4 hydrolase/aminopeptidase C-terminal domain-containing protein n=1 Tax=Adineta steineri TaxID=433720 RepID=A0A814P5J5_9BILA|nr:unnamed protein product [Adineta steineri]CAF1103115.1 unnamed protein product [Adineta steineri]